MIHWLCNVIVHWLLPHSDFAMAGYEHRSLARAEIAIACAHLSDASAFLGYPMPGSPRGQPKPRTAPVIKHLPEKAIYAETRGPSV
jgi:hypothetical protein